MLTFMCVNASSATVVTCACCTTSTLFCCLAALKPDAGVAVTATLGPSHQGVGEQALVAAVLGTGAAQEQLVPALMKAYAAADYVVGLDVDKDQFDKFGMRNCIDLILLELWKDPGQLPVPFFCYEIEILPCHCSGRHHGRYCTFQGPETTCIVVSPCVGLYNALFSCK